MTLNKSRAFPFCPKNAEGNINPLLRSEEPKTPGMLYVHTKERIKTSHVCVGKAVKKKKKTKKKKQGPSRLGAQLAWAYSSGSSSMDSSGGLIESEHPCPYHHWSSSAMPPSLMSSNIICAFRLISTGR